MVKQYGIIGCGMMGWEHIANINLLQGAEVAVVYDPVKSLSEAAAQKAGGAVIARSIKDLVLHKGLDAVVIVSPNNLHVEHLEEISRHKDIPILCEKPFYTHPDQAARLDRFLAAHKSPVWVAMEYRYMPAITKLLEKVEDVTGGIKMFSIKEHRIPFLQKVGHWNRFNENSGGTLVEKCCHFFDLMRLALNSEPVRVSATAGQIINHHDEVYEGKRSDIWDGGYVIFDFENGSRAMLELCMFADGTLWNEEISAVGPKGKIECRLPGPQRFWPKHLGASPHAQLSTFPRSPKNPVTEDVIVDEALVLAGDHHGSTFFQHEKFLQVICEQGEVEVTPLDGKKAVKMGLLAQEAAMTHKTLIF